MAFWPKGLYLSCQHKQSFFVADTCKQIVGRLLVLLMTRHWRYVDTTTHIVIWLDGCLGVERAHRQPSAHTQVTHWWRHLSSVQWWSHCVWLLWQNRKIVGLFILLNCVCLALMTTVKLWDFSSCSINFCVDSWQSLNCLAFTFLFINLFHVALFDGEMCLIMSFKKHLVVVPPSECEWPQQLTVHTPAASIIYTARPGCV